MVRFDGFLNLDELVKNFLGDFRLPHLASNKEIVTLGYSRGEIGLS